MDDGVGGAVAVQQLEGSWLHNQGAALVAPDRYPVDDAEGDAVEGELEREGGANGPRAHNQNVAATRHGGRGDAPSVRCIRRQRLTMELDVVGGWGDRKCSFCNLYNAYEVVGW